MRMQTWWSPKWQVDGNYQHNVADATYPSTMKSLRFTSDKTVEVYSPAPNFVTGTAYSSNEDNVMATLNPTRADGWTNNILLGYRLTSDKD